MDLLPQLVNAGVVLVLGVVLNWTISGKFREQNRYMDSRFDQLDGRMNRLETRIDRLEDRIERLRSDVTQIALALRAHTHPEAG